MKKVLALLASGALIFTLYACSNACQDACDKLEECNVPGAGGDCECDDDRAECVADCVTDASCDALLGQDPVGAASYTNCVAGCA